MEVLSIVVHVSAAAILVGPQLLMFYAVMPSTWLIDDERLKSNVVHVVASRFGQLAGAALVVLLATGLYQFYVVTPEHIREDMISYRYGQIFAWKMTFFAVLVVLILVHAFVFARRISRLSEAVIAGTEDPGVLEQWRMRSFMFSLLLMAVSFGTLWLGIMLGRPEFAYVQVDPFR